MSECLKVVIGLGIGFSGASFLIYLWEEFHGR